MSDQETERLDDDRVRARLGEIPGWSLTGGKLCRDLVFADFVEAFGFMARTALLAEAIGHHPDWSNVYNRVTVELQTHDVGGISDRDFALATRINALLED
jgi:4a-hydroxytetrahydrobiopterin dehydratase